MTTLTSPGVYTPHFAHSNSSSVPTGEPPATLVPAHVNPTPTPPALLDATLAAHCNRRTLADKLRHIIQDLPRQLVANQPLSRARAQMETALAAQLKNTTMYVCENSTYPAPEALPANRLVSLEAYLLSGGMEVPTTLEALVQQQSVIGRQAQAHPLGNLSGALSWPVAMPAQDQRDIIALMHDNSSGLADLPLADSAKGALGYLLSGSAVAGAALNSPVLAMEQLLGSPKAQALGQAIQSRLDGSGSGIGSSAYVLTAIHLGLDPESLATPARNSVAGFDLANSQHWGQPPSVVLEGLGKHLVEKGRASTQTAQLAASLLLAKTAPEFLIRDIPAGVTCASALWAHLAMSVGRLEAQTPGRTLGMRYAEVLLAAEQLDTDAAVSQQIDRQALINWGVANGFLGTAEQAPSTIQMERVRAAYNDQLSVLKTTSSLLQTPIPSREAMALAQLQEAFPGLDVSLFKVRNIQKARLKEGRPGLYPGLRSMLDIVMEGGKLGGEDHWISNDKRLPINRFCSLYGQGKLDVSTSFKAQFDASITAQEGGQQARVRHLISTLPLADRKRLESAKLEFFRTDQYKIAGDLFTPPALYARGHTLEVKATGSDGQVDLYRIDTRRGTVQKQNFLIRRRTEPFTANKMHEREANVLSKTQLFEPDKAKYAEQFQVQPEGARAPDSFSSARSHAIADVFVQALDLKNDDLLKEARGVTSYDQDSARNEAISEFFLNLIPLRSAIVNFGNGNIGQGVFDLAMDAVGLITLGAGKAAQAGKVVGSAVSTVGKVAKVSRFVGATLVEAFNPLSGAGDLIASGGRLVVNSSRAVSRQFNQLRGAAGSYALLKVASKHYAEAATGVFKVAGESVEGGAVLHKGKWYAFDAETMLPYGRPLDDFTPATRAVNGQITRASTVPEGELSNGLFGQFNVPASRITGLTRNHQGVYVAADGHLSHIRHTDSAGQTAVYEVRQVTRTADGTVQARVYHNNRQTPLLLEHVQGDQWRRLGARGGSPVSVKSDLGPEIGRGGEGTLYASLDGEHVYKDLGPTRLTTAEGYTSMEVVNMNTYYGDGVAEVIIDEGRKYIKMKKIDGVDLSKIEKGSLPPSARSLVDDALARMEAMDIYHNDPQMSNFMYSSKDNKVYPIDMDGLPAEFMVPEIMDAYNRVKAELRKTFNELIVANA
ncbi:hypothetical protein [Pseudomonas sp. ICMP 460]|uniref:OspG family effector kinase n=1 Tax=Pseudomonas sp. ICMP 460 TaxID=1718917 RepID=UPI000C0A3EFC|nr:hypothetical protein [Pseudomonas sp. ICMP 460]PHN18941.1 hypothetical protein AO240_17570 [Pseudomonas sp. ICMP 460]